MNRRLPQTKASQTRHTIPAIASMLSLLLSAAFARALPQPRISPARAPAAQTGSRTHPAAATIAGFSPLDPSPPTGTTPEEIIAKFGEREAAFAKARDQYTFRQSVKVETLAEDTNKPDGAYQQVTDIVFTDDGHRTEHVVSAPASTLERLMMSQADFEDIAHRLPFVLTTPELPQYDLTYLGRQRVDEIDTYVFDCRPKVLEKGKRYFQGKVWVDQRELEIVLINGKSVPDDLRRGHEDLSPPYTTYYSEVDGGYWFPVYTKAEGNLHFAAQQGALTQDVHIRYVVKYEDYRRFHARSRVIYNGEDLPPADSPQAPSQAAPQAPSQTAPHAPSSAPPK